MEVWDLRDIFMLMSPGWSCSAFCSCLVLISYSCFRLDGSVEDGPVL